MKIIVPASLRRLFLLGLTATLGRLFAQEALRGGAWLHPQHNMFLSSAHTEADIDKALQATDSAMAVVKKHFGRD